MRVGITGSSGLIGSALSRALEENGDTVIRFTRTDVAETDTIRWDPRRGVVNESDLRQYGTLDAVVHLAGAGIADKRWTPARREEILASRTKSTDLLSATLLSLPKMPSVVLSGSAIGYYGSRGDEVLAETTVRGDGFLADVCVAWENGAQPLRDHGVPVALLRTGIVMAKEGGALKKQLPLFRAGLGGRLASGRQWLSPISLFDHVRAMRFLLQNPLDGPVNLVAPEPLTNQRFTKELARAVHRPAIAHVPRAALAAALGAELVDEAILASQRVVPERLLSLGFTFEDASTASILERAIRRP